MSALAYNIVDGITWGAGNAMGHRFVEFFAGPRTIQVVSSEPQAVAADSSLDSCGAHNKAFADCLNHSQSDISRCQFYLDLLNQCRRGSSNA
uniref:CHCH domain-containing protein n=1 Tax=Triticum urartu TaxID=4572 RepID=A0A8R7Q9K9_TRIUA